MSGDGGSDRGSNRVGDGDTDREGRRTEQCFVSSFPTLSECYCLNVAWLSIQMILRLDK